MFTADSFFLLFFSPCPSKSAGRVSPAASRNESSTGLFPYVSRKLFQWATLSVSLSSSSVSLWKRDCTAASMLSFSSRIFPDSTSTSSVLSTAASMFLPMICPRRESASGRPFSSGAETETTLSKIFRPYSIFPEISIVTVLTGTVTAAATPPAVRIIPAKAAAGIRYPCGKALIEVNLAVFSGSGTTSISTACPSSSPVSETIRTMPSMHRTAASPLRSSATTAFIPATPFPQIFHF